MHKVFSNAGTVKINVHIVNYKYREIVSMTQIPVSEPFLIRVFLKLYATYQPNKFM